MELTLGPILFEWSRDKALDFYKEVSRMPVDRVYLGEVVCAKKRCLSVKDLGEVGAMLEGAGKKVVLSTLAVVSNEEELGLVRDLTRLPFPVEANEMCVFNIIEGTGKEVSAGPHIQSYSTDDIEFLKGLGVARVAMPVELPGETVRYNIEKTGIEAEVFAHGKVPLAFSWRCYTGKAFGRTKTECVRDCAKFPDGMEVKTLDGEPAFTINGTSVLSAQTLTLVESVEELKVMGVKALRLSPHHIHTKKVVEVFNKRLNGTLDGAGAIEELRDTAPLGFSDGWFHARAGRDYLGVRSVPAGI